MIIWILWVSLMAWTCSDDFLQCTSATYREQPWRYEAAFEDKALCEKRAKELTKEVKIPGRSNLTAAKTTAEAKCRPVGVDPKY
jgi:hypothetical protein